MNEYELYEPSSEHHQPDIEGYEKGLRISGFAIWAVCTSLSVVGNITEQTDAFESSALAALGVGTALFTERVRHDRVKPYKEARNHLEA